jgi:hypothetical protein
VVLNPNFEYYKLPNGADVPPIDIVLLDMPERGVIGVGEPCHIPDGGRDRETRSQTQSASASPTLPITPDKVLRALGKVPPPKPNGRRAVARGHIRARFRSLPGRVVSRVRRVKAFEYVSAQTPQSASELAGKDGRFIAGGIDILGEIKDRIVEPKRLVNVKALPNSREIKPGDQFWTIGANVTGR